MKTTRILIAMTLIVFSTCSLFVNVASAQSQENPQSFNQRIDIRVNQDNQVVLRAECLKGHQWSNMVLKVFSENGKMVYGTSIHKKGGVYKAYDLSKFPEGKYTFSVYRKSKKVYSQDVYKSSELVSLYKAESKMTAQDK